MCIISGEVKQVSRTKIFVGPLEGNKGQLTVYCNKVAMDSEKGGTMILPVPVGKDGKADIRFVDMSRSKDFFDKLHDLWPVERSITLGIPKAKGFASLEVVTVGSYVASIVPDHPSFELLDKERFPVTKEVLDYLLKEYPSKHQFVAFSLERSSKEYHPFAYTHRIADDGPIMFIPTMHYHTHKGSKQSGEKHADWAHEIYMTNAKVARFSDKIESAETTDDSRRSFIQSLTFPEEVKMKEIRSVFGMKVGRNYKRNHDMRAAIIA